MIRVILIVALGMSGVFIATALNHGTTAQPAIAPSPCNCPGGAPIDVP